jgi:predicted transcriptional regulator
MTTCPIIWKIETRRSELGLTMQEMCGPAGVSYRTYQSWLYNGVDPTYTRLNKILTSIGLHLEVKENEPGTASETV